VVGIEILCAAAGCVIEAATVPVATSIAAMAATESSALLDVVRFVILSNYNNNTRYFCV
jgi:hypothetical protein